MLVWQGSKINKIFKKMKMQKHARDWTWYLLNNCSDFGEILDFPLLPTQIFCQSYRGFGRIVCYLQNKQKITISCSFLIMRIRKCYLLRNKCCEHRVFEVKLFSRETKKEKCIAEIALLWVITIVVKYNFTLLWLFYNKIFIIIQLHFWETCTCMKS